MTREQSEFLDKLYFDHSDKMARLTYRRIGDHELAKELVQETFLTASCKIEKLLTHNNPAGWLYVTLLNLTMREMGKSYHTEVPLNKVQLVGVEGIDLPMSECLPAGLKESDRELLLMRIDEEMSFAEIANIRGITEVACRQQVSRAMRRCKKLKLEENNT